MADPNWLLATMAQSAAAMVAVIGGFLVSRVITLPAERRGLDRRVREIRERAGDKKSILEKVRQNRQDISWDLFLDLAAEESAKARGNVSAERLAEDHWVRGVPDFNEMVEMSTELNEKMREACRRIERLKPRPSDPSPSLTNLGSHPRVLVLGLALSRCELVLVNIGPAAAVLASPIALLANRKQPPPTPFHDQTAASQKRMGGQLLLSQSRIDQVSSPWEDGTPGNDG